MPAQSGQVADRLGVAYARPEPQRQVPAQIGPGRGHGQADAGQQPAVPALAAGPGGQRAEEQHGRTALAGGVHQADPLLVGVQRGPVSQPGGRARHGAGQADADQHARGPVGTAEQVEQHGRRPAAEGQPHQRGMYRLAERNTMQRVGTRAGRQGAHHGIGQPADDRIERLGLLDALGQGRRPPAQAWLAVRARSAGRGERWPHDKRPTRQPGCLPLRPVTNRCTSGSRRTRRQHRMIPGPGAARTGTMWH
jgi:hypothetical protein